MILQFLIQEPHVNNQNDLFMHFLVINRNGQVATDGCNGQVFFQYLARKAYAEHFKMRKLNIEITHTKLSSQNLQQEARRLLCACTQHKDKLVPKDL